MVAYLLLMDEGTLKTPIPYCRLYWSFLFGVMRQFCRFYKSGQTQSVKLLQNSVWSTAQFNTPTPPPQPHTVCIYCTFSLGGGEGGDVREKVEGQQNTSIVPSSMGATVHKLGQKYQS